MRSFAGKVPNPYLTSWDRIDVSTFNLGDRFVLERLKLRRQSRDARLQAQPFAVLLVFQIGVFDIASRRGRRRAYCDLNMSVLEIDLASFRYATADELREAVLKRATRYWLCLSGGREVPRRPEPTKSGGIDKQRKLNGFARPKSVSQREWAEMSTLEKITAVDPDGRLTIKSRGYRS